MDELDLQLTDRQKAILLKAQTKISQMEQQQAANARKKAEVQPLPLEETIDENKKINPVSFIYAGLEAAKAGRQQATANAQQNVRKAAQAVDDLVRVGMGPMGDALEGAMTDATIKDAAAKTGEAKARLGPSVSTMAEAGGMLAQSMALPGSSFATPMRAAMSGGGISAADSLFGRMGEGKPLFDQEGMSNLISDTAQGMTGGFAGYHLGKSFGHVLMKALKLKPNDQVTRQAQRLSKANERISQSAGDAMKNSQVLLNPQAMSRLVFRIQNQFHKGLIGTRQEAPHAYKALDLLKTEVGRGRQTDLTTFNDIRRHINRSIRKPSGELSDSLYQNDMDGVWKVLDEMNDFIQTLPQRKNGFISGDVKGGVDAWKRMNDYYQREARTNMLGDIIGRAERRANSVTQRISIDRALREEFFGAVHTEAGQAALKRHRFTEKQIDAMRDVANGGPMDKAIGVLDRIAGKGMLSFIVDSTSLANTAAFGADAARFQTRQALEAVSQMGGQGLAGTAIPGAAGGMMGAAGAPQMPNVADRASEPNMPPVGQGISPPATGGRKMRELVGPAGMTGAPTFPEVPGLEGTKVPGGKSPFN